MSILEVDKVSFGYDPDKPIISDVSFKIDEPEFICVVGPNGVGKSTLVKCITGYIKTTSGSIYVNGKNIRDYKLKELAQEISYVPVATKEYNVMSVLDTVLVGRYSKQKWKSSAYDLKKAYKALEALQVEDLAHKRFNELSAGQHQKVALARGLVQEANILILDEPTSNLDPRHQVYVSAFLKSLRKLTGTTVIMISHDLNLSAKYADRLIVLEPPGVVHSIGTPAEVITREMVRRVYGVDCDISDDHGVPHVVLQDVIFE